MTTSESFATDRMRSDRGSVLPITLVVSFVLSMVVVSVASYTTTTLRYGTVVEARANRLAAAEAAMRDAIERLRIVDELCTTSNGSDEPINPSFPDINGISAQVRCRTFGTELPPSDGWAIVVTGRRGSGAAPLPTFTTTAGGNPVIEGPVYVHHPNGIAFKDTTIKNGSLWYTDTACAGGLSFQESDIAIASLSFDPAIRKVYCVGNDWDRLFDETPPVPAVGSFGAPVAPPDDETYPGCRVFSPGRYTGSIDLAADNYFRSGTYLFENLGTVSLHQQKITFGTVAPEDDPIYPLLPLAGACEAARNADEDKGGATVYVDGTTNFRIGAQSHIEIVGRQQGPYIVSLQALPTSTSPDLVTTGSGNNKESAFSGLVWAPYSRVEIGTVAAQKEAAFRGGIVIGSFHGTISAAPSGGFLIRVPTSQASVKLMLQSTATDDTGSTSIRVIADYRPSRGDIAINSWRVCETSDCS